MRVLVTGGAGFIGWNLVEALTRDGVEVVALDNLHRGLPYRPISGVRFVFGDVRDRETVRDAMAGCRYVFHLAAQSRVLAASEDLDDAVSTNVLGVVQTLRCASDAGVERVVFASSREVYGQAQQLPVAETSPLRPRNAYGASKVAGEAFCATYQQTFGLDVSVLRLANVYGPGDEKRLIPTWLDRARHGQDLELFGGNQILDFIHVDYVIQALRRAAEMSLGESAVNVGSGMGYSLRELAQRIANLADGHVNLHVLPARHEEVVSFVADITQMRTLLGLEPPANPLVELERMWLATPIGAPTRHS